MLIEVTKDDIKQGIREDECNCPIALAVCRAAESELTDDQLNSVNIIAVVTDTEIGVYHHNNNAEMDHMYDIEPEDPNNWNFISDFIHHFDKDRTAEPFDMVFDVYQQIKAH